MAKYNTPTTNTTTNHEGAVAYSMSAELELYSLAVTSMMADSFYEKESEKLARLRSLIKQVRPEFVAKLAIYAREQMYLRTLPIVLVVELAKVHSGDSLVSTTLARVIQRVDEITETLAYHAIANERTGTKKLNGRSKQIRKGLSLAFNKFDEYQFGKYDRAGAVTLKDAIFDVHPVPKDQPQQDLFNKIITGTLAIPFTWETEVSAKGNIAEVWENLIDSGKLPYMATLRNLRNMLEANVKFDAINKVCEMLQSPEQVRKSKQFPFRYFSAYKELHETAKPLTAVVLDALESAVKESVVNIKGFGPEVVVAIASDVSSSMEDPVSPKSKVERYDIGLLLSMILHSKCKAVVAGIFGDTFKIVGLPQSNILANTMDLHKREGEVGYSTNGHLVLRNLEANNIKADKVMMFTDCQMWNSSNSGDSMQKAWTSYKKFNPTAKLYLFDLAGYGTTPVTVHGSDVYVIAGWSDRIFDMLHAYENGSTALKEIESIVI